jgi:phosphatidylglycerophosphate synthase
MTPSPVHATDLSSLASRVRLLGVLLVPEGFDARTQIGGLEPLLRHALSMQAAGVDAVAFLGVGVGTGNSAGPAAELARTARLTIPVLTALPAHDRALVLRADVSPHRNLPARMASLDGALIAAGDAGAALCACEGSRTEAVLDALARESLPEGARQEPLAGEGAFAEFIVRAATKEERAIAHDLHLRSLRKPTGGVFEQLYMRPLSMWMTRALCHTGVTPNQMSVVTLLVALLSGALIALPDPAMSVAGGLLHIFMRVVDCIDGELARLKYQGSRFGEWLDTIGDGIGMAAFLGGVTWHAAREQPDLLLVGVVGTVAWALVQALQVVGALAVGATGTFHKVEWGHRAARKNPIERFVSSIEMALRIDAISTYYGIAVALGLHAQLLSVHTPIALIACVYFGAQVVRLRARARA